MARLQAKKNVADTKGRADQETQPKNSALVVAEWWTRRLVYDGRRKISGAKFCQFLYKSLQAAPWLENLYDPGGLKYKVLDSNIGLEDLLCEILQAFREENGYLRSDGGPLPFGPLTILFEDGQIFVQNQSAGPIIRLEYPSMPDGKYKEGGNIDFSEGASLCTGSCVSLPQTFRSYSDYILVPLTKGQTYAYISQNESGRDVFRGEAKEDEILVIQDDGRPDFLGTFLEKGLVDLSERESVTNTKAFAIQRESYIVGLNLEQAQGRLVYINSEGTFVRIFDKPFRAVQAQDPFMLAQFLRKQVCYIRVREGDYLGAYLPAPRGVDLMESGHKLDCPPSNWVVCNEKGTPLLVGQRPEALVSLRPLSKLPKLKK